MGNEKIPLDEKKILRLFRTSNNWPVTFLLYGLECYFFQINMDHWIWVVVYNSKTFLENMTQPFLKILKQTFFWDTMYN